MEQIQNILSQIKLWQCAFVISIALLALGFTGGIPFTEIELRDGKGIAAIVSGVAFFIGAVILRYIPPPETEVPDVEKDVETGQQDGKDGRGDKKAKDKRKR